MNVVRPRQLCRVCGLLTVVRPNGLFRVHPVAKHLLPHCLGSGAQAYRRSAAPSRPSVDAMQSRRLAYLQLLLNLIDRHGYRPDLCDRAERTIKVLQEANQR